jgi:hypothetical protein
MDGVSPSCEHSPGSPTSRRDMSGCIHGLAAGTCSICHAQSRFGAVVYISGGGQTFHRTSRCWALHRGQRRVEHWGGEVADVVRVSPAEALERGRQPCAACWIRQERELGTVREFDSGQPPDATSRARVWMSAEEYGRPGKRSSLFHRTERCPALLDRQSPDGVHRPLEVPVGRALAHGARPCSACYPAIDV